MYRKKDEICGKCYYHHKHYEEWCCDNPDSDCYGCATEYNDTCLDFEDRANSGFSVSLK